MTAFSTAVASHDPVYKRVDFGKKPTPAGPPPQPYVSDDRAKFIWDALVHTARGTTGMTPTTEGET